tara:strand:- start:28 stop:375 length:348 start_codon:yes stop_codon:yes gene_type:complete
MDDTERNKQRVKNLRKGPGPGRPKGMQNKFSGFRQDLYEAYQKNGGVEWLARWAKKQPTQFMQIMSKLLPKVVESSVEIKRPIGELSNDELLGIIQRKRTVDGTGEPISGEQKFN